MKKLKEFLCWAGIHGPTDFQTLQLEDKRWHTHFYCSWCHEKSPQQVTKQEIIILVVVVTILLAVGIWLNGCTINIIKLDKGALQLGTAAAQVTPSITPVRNPLFGGGQ